MGVMSIPKTGFPADNIELPVRPSHISAADQHAFETATRRLRQALERAARGGRHSEVVEARLDLRAIAVKLRDAGMWRADKQGLRATVSLLWEADRFVSDQALAQVGSESSE